MNDKKCEGCGVRLQKEDILSIGYIDNIDHNICKRCFKLKNYGEYQIVTKSNDEYIDILKSIGKTKDLVLLIIDITNINQDLNFIREYIDNEIILVLNKIDVIPRSVKNEKIIAYIKDQYSFFKDIVITSCNNNYNIDSLYRKINKYKKSSNVYVVGNTNVGKSSLINKFINNYSDKKHELTISVLPSTTLNKIDIKLNEEITLIDTPGLIDEGNITNYIDHKNLKNLNNKKEMKPKTFQIKPNQCLIIGDIFRIDYVNGESNSFTVYISNSIIVKRMNAIKQNILTDLPQRELNIKENQDLVINGVCWVKIVNEALVNIYINEEVEVFTRKSII